MVSDQVSYHSSSIIHLMGGKYAHVGIVNPIGTGGQLLPNVWGTGCLNYVDAHGRVLWPFWGFLVLLVVLSGRDAQIMKKTTEPVKVCLRALGEFFGPQSPSDFGLQVCGIFLGQAPSSDFGSENH